MRRYGFGVALLLAILVVASPIWADGGVQVDEKLLVKIDPALLRELEQAPDGMATFLVYLGGQADLMPATTIESRAERGGWVYDTLRAHAGCYRFSRYHEIDRRRPSANMTCGS